VGERRGKIGIYSENLVFLDKRGEAISRRTGEGYVENLYGFSVGELSPFFPIG